MGVTTRVHEDGDSKMAVSNKGETVHKIEQDDTATASHARLSPTLVEIFLPSGALTCAVHRYLLGKETVSECESVLWAQRSHMQTYPGGIPLPSLLRSRLNEDNLNSTTSAPIKNGMTNQRK